MIIAIIYIIFLCDISSAVKNYFQQILSPPEKFHSPLKIQKVQVPPLFASIENFSAPPPPPPCRKEGGGRTLRS